MNVATFKQFLPSKSNFRAFFFSAWGGYLIGGIRFRFFLHEPVLGIGDAIFGVVALYLGASYTFALLRRATPDAPAATSGEPRLVHPPH